MMNGLDWPPRRFSNTYANFMNLQVSILFRIARWYVQNVSIIFDGFMLILCFWHLFLYKVYDLFRLTY
jgi:hypothetical protein